MKRTPSKMPPGSAWISKETLQDPRLNGNDIKVLMGLCSYANAETDETFVSQETLAREFNLSKRTINTSIQRLVECGKLKKELRNRKTKRGRTTNVYTILNDSTDDLSAKIALNNENDDVLSAKNAFNKPDLSAKIAFKTNATQTEASALKGENLSSNKNNLNNNKNNLNTRETPINMSKRNSLFDIASDSVTPLSILSALRDGTKDKALRLAEFILDGQLDGSTLTELDLCYYYQARHLQIVGYPVSVNRTERQSQSSKTSMSYMSEFRMRYNLTPRQAFDLIPTILEDFKSIMIAEKQNKSNWKLHIGHLTWTGNCYIEKIMNKAKPKVNEKYLETKKEEVAASNPYDLVDEVF